MYSVESLLKEKPKFKGAYVNGGWKLPSRPSGTWECISPANIDWVLPPVSYAFDQASEAVSAGRTAFKNWSKLGLHQRIEYLQKWGLEIQKRSEKIAQYLSLETGKPFTESLAETDLLLSKISTFIKEGVEVVSSSVIDLGDQGKGEIHYRPKGLLVTIGPFNLALSLPHGFHVAALLTGNTVIFKPSEKTPYSAQVYMEAAEAAGFPAGVFQMVQGGAEIGTRLVRDTDVSGVLATCSFDVGTQIQKELAETPQRIVALQMGAKNSAIVWDGADLDSCADSLVKSAFMTTGQRCTALPRVYVQKSLIHELVQKVHLLTKELSISHPFDDEQKPFMGPLVSASAKEKFFRYMSIAESDDCEVIMRSKALEGTSGRLNKKPLPLGHYVTPSIHLLAKPSFKSAYQNHEIFGPDIFFCPIENIEEGVLASNSCGYGLAFSLFGGSESLFKKVADEIESGIVYWNRGTVGTSSRLPFGGWKKSGNHRPGGLFSVLTTTQVQTRLLKQ
jgi:succinylglutamic semialdehyde dehydrogenase